MTIELEMQIEKTLLQESLEDLQQRRTPRFRQRLTQRVLEQVVDRVVARHPVETGRARDAWLSAASQTRTGTSGNTNDAQSDRTEDADRTSVEATNEVDYVVYLENGTRRMRPFHIVRRALAESPLIVAQTADELAGELLG
jgi:hypothetical protein